MSEPIESSDLLARTGLTIRLSMRDGRYGEEQTWGPNKVWQAFGQGVHDDIAAKDATITKLRAALQRAHCCATLRDDGTCEGCFVSTALDECGQSAAKKSLGGEAGK